jgi:hypothetical protein
LLFDPNRVKEILKEYDTTSDNNTGELISLDRFITTYLELESSVKDFISNENDNALVDTMPLYDIVDNYNKDFKEISDHLDSFNEIIFHRNNVIHNYTDTTVDPAKYNKLLELIDVFERRNTSFVQKNIFTNVLSVKNSVEKTIKEYLNDVLNKANLKEDDTRDIKEELVSLLHSYFINDFYTTRSFDEAMEADFEVIQNNYSERKLVAIDVKALNMKHLSTIIEAHFKRLNTRFMYVFLINYISEKQMFQVMYQTKDKELRTILVK